MSIFDWFIKNNIMLLLIWTGSQFLMLMFEFFINARFNIVLLKIIFHTISISLQLECI